MPWMLGLLAAACTGAPDTVPDTTTPEGDEAALSRFEERLLSTQLNDIRSGVRPWGDASLGICTHTKGDRSCPSFLGADAGELAPGDHQLFAELRVPTIGAEGTWTVDVHTECDITGRDGATRQQDYDKSYTVRYAGEDRGYRLAPLVTISSPSAGKRSCRWTLTAPHPDREIVYAGSWSTPDKDEP